MKKPWNKDKRTRDEQCLEVISHDDFSKLIRSKELKNISKTNTEKPEPDNERFIPTDYDEQDMLDRNEIKQTSRIEKLIWLLKNILNVRKRDEIVGNTVVCVKLKEIVKKPFFISSTIREELEMLFVDINENKDFFRKYDMRDYKPRFKIDPYDIGDDVIGFYDLTNDFTESYLGYIGWYITETKPINLRAKERKITPPELPDNLKWEDIIIRFLNNNEIHVTLPSKTYSTDYELMGFRDEKSKKPNVQWDLLKILSEMGGVLSWKNNRNLNTKEAGKIRKREQLLSNTLKTYFHTAKDEPFLEYKKEKAYKIRIKLIPEQGTAVEPDYSNALRYKEISDTEDNERAIQEMFGDIRPERDISEFTQE